MSHEIKFNIILYSKIAEFNQIDFESNRYAHRNKDIAPQLNRRSAETWEKIQLMDFDVN